MKTILISVLCMVSFAIPEAAFASEASRVPCALVKAAGVLDAGAVGLVNAIGTAVVFVGDAGTASWKFKQTRHAAFLTQERAKAGYRDLVAANGCVADQRHKAVVTELPAARAESASHSTVSALAAH